MENGRKRVHLEDDRRGDAPSKPIKLARAPEHSDTEDDVAVQDHEKAEAAALRAEVDGAIAAYNFDDAEGSRVPGPATAGSAADGFVRASTPRPGTTRAFEAGAASSVSGGRYFSDRSTVLSPRALQVRRDFMAAATPRHPGARSVGSARFTVSDVQLDYEKWVSLKSNTAFETALHAGVHECTGALHNPLIDVSRGEWAINATNNKMVPSRPGDFNYPIMDWAPMSRSYPQVRKGDTATSLEGRRTSFLRKAHKDGRDHDIVAARYWSTELEHGGTYHWATQVVYNWNLFVDVAACLAQVATGADIDGIWKEMKTSREILFNHGYNKRSYIASFLSHTYLYLAEKMLRMDRNSAVMNMWLKRTPPRTEPDPEQLLLLRARAEAAEVAMEQDAFARGPIEVVED